MHHPQQEPWPVGTPVRVTLEGDRRHGERGTIARAEWISGAEYWLYQVAGLTRPAWAQPGIYPAYLARELEREA